MVNLSKEIPASIYWSPNDIFSFNRLYNMVIGERGVGKTYSIKKFLINRFLKTGEQFVYVRRYKTHLKGGTVFKFFDKIAKEFPGVKFNVKGNTFYINGKEAGYAIALSTWQTSKGSEYPYVSTIFYDEFLKEKDGSHYVDNEPKALLSLMESIFREKLTLDAGNVRVILAANSTSTANPYFVYFKLHLNKDKRFTTFKHNNEIVVELTDQFEYREAKKHSRFADLIKGTEYEEISINNTFIYDNDEFIEKRTKESKCIFNIKYGNHILGVWVDDAKALMFVSNKHDVGQQVFAVTKNDFTKKSILVVDYRKVYPIRRMISGFHNKQVRFDNQIIQDVMYEIFTKWNVK